MWVNKFRAVVYFIVPVPLSAGQVLFSKAETRLFIVVQLCQRNSANIDEAAREVVFVFNIFIMPFLMYEFHDGDERRLTLSSLVYEH